MKASYIFHKPFINHNTPKTDKIDLELIKKYIQKEEWLLSSMMHEIPDKATAEIIICISRVFGLVMPEKDKLNKFLK